MSELIAVNGAELFVRRMGSGPPLYLLHGGLGFDHQYFLPWLEPLADEFELVLYDHRGNGRSSTDLDGVTFDTWVDDLDALRAALGHDRIAVVGHSFGGFIAQRFGSRYPGSVTGLVLMGTASTLGHFEHVIAWVGEHGTPEQLEPFTGGEITSDEQFKEMWRLVLPLYFKNRDLPAIAEVIDATVFRVAGATKGGQETGELDLTADAAAISCPTLVIGGRHDFVMPPQHTTDALAATVPGADYEVFERSGHFPFVEEHPEFLDRVGAWLRTHVT